MSDPNATPPPYGEPTPPPTGGPTPPPYGAGSPHPAPGPVNYGRQPPARPGGLTSDELMWGSAAHWSSLVAAVIALAFLGPLIVMLTKGNESEWVRRNAVESLNFQLSILIYGAISLALCFVLIGFVLLPIVGLAWLVCTIIGSVKAARGEEYRYPLTIRMVH
jgi:uncharacterized Tic20 family protein